MPPFSDRAYSTARRMISRSAQLQRLVWPTTEGALGRRRDAAIVVGSVFRALTGQEPTPAERSELLRKVRDGLDFAGLVEEVQSRPEAATRTAVVAPAALRQTLELELELESAQTADPSSVPVLFLHIMKTAGTSLSELLKQWAGPGRSRVAVPLDDLLLMPQLELSRMLAVSGHFPYEALTLLPDTFRTVTVLRDPVARTLSHYVEITRRHGPARDLTLDEFLHSEEYAVPSGNYQARQLAHTIDLAHAWVSYSPMQLYLQAGGTPEQPYPLQALFDSTPIFMDDDELLKKASANLAQIDIIGVTNEMNSLVERLASLFGAAPVDVPRLNASPPSRLLTDLSPSVRREIERRTEVDRELYQQATRLSRA